MAQDKENADKVADQQEVFHPYVSFSIILTILACLLDISLAFYLALNG